MDSHFTAVSIPRINKSDDSVQAGAASFMAASNPYKETQGFPYSRRKFVWNRAFEELDFKGDSGASFRRAPLNGVLHEFTGAAER